MSTISLSKKGVEVFLRHLGTLSEISKQEDLFGIANIIENQYIIHTTGYFPNNILEKVTMNAVIPIFIQTWHQRIGPLGYQNVLHLPKMADGIDVKKYILEKICGNCMKGRQ